MGYTPEKISNAQLKQAILDAIKDRLDQHPDIGQNDSVSYFGVHVEFDIKLTLISRATIDTSVSGKKLIGDPNGLAELQKTDQLHATTSTATGEVHKGRKKNATDKASV